MNQNQQEHDTHTHPDMSFDWRGALAALSLFAFLFLAGPLIFLSLALQFWASRLIWHAPDRWAGIRTLAWIFPLLVYPPTILFHTQIAAFWAAHLPGDFSIWPPTFSGIGARSVLALPLAFALALLLERTNPRSLPLRFMIRRPRPGEMIAPHEPRKEELQRFPTAPEKEPLQVATASSSGKRHSETATTKSTQAGQRAQARGTRSPTTWYGPGRRGRTTHARGPTPCHRFAHPGGSVRAEKSPAVI